MTKKQKILRLDTHSVSVFKQRVLEGKKKKAHRREFDPIQRSRHVSAGFLRVFVQKQRRARRRPPWSSRTPKSAASVPDNGLVPPYPAAMWGEG